MLGICVGFIPIRAVLFFDPIYFRMFEKGTWERLTTAGSATYHPLLGSLIIGEIIINFSIVLASIYLIYLFVSKHNLFPKVFIAIAAAWLIFISLDSWIVSLRSPNASIFDPPFTDRFITILITVHIWIPYLFFSKRVKATFVRGMPNGQVRNTADTSVEKVADDANSVGMLENKPIAHLGEVLRPYLAASPLDSRRRGLHTGCVRNLGLSRSVGRQRVFFIHRCVISARLHHHRHR